MNQDSKKSLPLTLSQLNKMIKNGEDLTHINVSEIEDMSELFFDNEPVGDISGWDVQGVISMYGMFRYSKFNEDISNWDVSGVMDMGSMFYGSEFSGNISGWNVSGVTDMWGMFEDSQFNGDINQWDVSNVTDMRGIFDGAKFSRYQDLACWNIHPNARENFKKLEPLIKRALLSDEGTEIQVIMKEDLSL